MKNRYTIAALAALMLATSTAQAQFQRPDDAVKYRQGALFVMGQHFGRVGAMASGRVPFDAQVAQQNMDVVMALSTLPWAGFGPETQSVNSRAKPNVWTDRAAFDEAGRNTLVALAALNEATRTGNLEAVRRTFGAAAATCKVCHDNFRN
jgi:cytochrome c556